MKNKNDEDSKLEVNTMLPLDVNTIEPILKLDLDIFKITEPLNLKINLEEILSNSSLKPFPDIDTLIVETNNYKKHKIFDEIIPENLIRSITIGYLIKNESASKIATEEIHNAIREALCTILPSEIIISCNYVRRERDRQASSIIIYNVR